MNLRKKKFVTFSLLLFFTLGTLFFNHSTVTVSNAAEGDAVAATYEIPLVGGSPSLSASNFSTIEWIHAALMRVTFANGMTLDFTPVNDANNGEPPLKDQRLYSADGEGIVTYEADDWPCRARITFDKNEDRDDPDFALSRLTDGLLDIDFKPDSTRGCSDAGDFNVSVSNPDLSIAYFAWVDETTIATVDGETPGRFTRAVENGTSYFIRDSDSSASSCIDKALVNSAANTLIWWELRDDNRANFQGNPPAEANTDDGCEYRTSSENEAGAGQFGSGFPPNNRTIFIAGTPTSPVDVVDLGAASSAPTCESEGGIFSFILCPALDYANDAIGWLDDRIISALTVNNAYYDNDSIKDAWANIRNVGYIILIPVLLLMVIGTALQFSFLDAYTVKRSLPRLFVAIIFMAISYDFCRILIEIVNGVGRGVGGLIASPFGGYDALTLPNIFSAPEGGGNLIWGGILGAVGVASLFVVSIGILFSYLFIAALALLIIFILLSIRELLIIFLIIMSPIAIVSWIFPGNDKLWKLWWGTFTKMLYIFPIIMAILTTGRAFAYIIKTTPTDENAVVLTIVKLTAFIGPYFFIPKAFQMAGGAFASIAGMVNDRGKGLFDRQRKYRGERIKKNLEDTAAGNRFKGKSNKGVYSKLNNLGNNAYSLKNATYRPGQFKSSMKAGQTNQIREEYAHLMKDDVAMSTLNNDDAAAAGVAGDGTYQAAYEYLTKIENEDGTGRKYTDEDAKNIASEVISVKKKYGDHAYRAAAVVSMAGSKTSFQGGPSEMLSAIMEAAHGDKQLAATLYAQARGKAEQAGRVDLAGYSYGDGLAMANKIWTTKDQPNAEDISKDVNEYLLDRVVDSKSVGQILSSHGTSVKNLTTSMVRRYSRSAGAYSDAQVQFDSAMDKLEQNPDDPLIRDYANISQANLVKAKGDHMRNLARIAQAQDQMAYFSPENQEEFYEKLATTSAATIGNRTDIAADSATTSTYTVVPVVENVVDEYNRPILDAAGNQVTRTRDVVQKQSRVSVRPKNIMEEIKQARSDPAFNVIHRELGADQAEALARNQGQIPGAGGI